MCERPTYFLAMDTTSRRFASVSRCLATKSPFSIALASLHLFIAGEQRNAANFLQVHLDQVRSVVALTEIHHLVFLLRALYGNLFFLFADFQHFLRTDDTNTRGLKLLIQVLEIVEVLFDVRQDVDDFIFRDKAALLAASEKFIESILFQLFMRRSS